MVLKYQISAYPTLMEDMVVRIWEAESDGPGGWVYEQVIPEDGGGGHPNKTTIIANGLDRVVHIVRLFTASGVELHSYNEEPKVEVVTVFDPIRFKIGDGGDLTPAAGTISYTDPVLEGLGDDDYEIHRNNYGILFPNVHYTTDSVLGRWSLIPADQFGENEEFTIKRKTQVITNVTNDSVVGKLFKGKIDVNVNMDYNATHLRNLLCFSGSVEYTFTNLVAVPKFYLFSFQHFGAAGVCKINFNNGDLIWAGANKDTIDIPQYTQGAFVWDGVNWNVVYISNSAFVNAGTMAPNTIVGTGVFAYGDVHVGDPARPVIHNLNIDGDYNVVLCIKSNTAALAHRNDRCQVTWYHDATVSVKKNRFWIMMDEITGGEVQDLSISWVIIKT
ncbi:MAG TPA: hypothetical protein VEA37_13975 [Flavobacterium sp.]|nr:hypothetical protein [Flavobacterium sp.]